jgi:hypothetical protein
MYSEDKHRAWLTEMALPYRGASRYVTIDGTGCFVCATPLPVADDCVCTACGRVSCSSCGACCCGRQQYEDDVANLRRQPWSSKDVGKRIKRERDHDAMLSVIAAARKKKEV